MSHIAGLIFLRLASTERVCGLSHLKRLKCNNDNGIGYFFPEKNELIKNISPEYIIYFKKAIFYNEIPHNSEREYNIVHIL